MHSQTAKTHWSERAQEGLRDTARFLSDHGFGFMLANYGLWGSMTATTAYMAASAENPMLIDQLQAMATSLGATGILVSGGIGVATAVTNQMLNKLDFRDQRAAVSQFDQIVETLQTKPDAKSTEHALGTLNDFIRQSPEGRQQLIESLGIEQVGQLDKFSGNGASTKRNADVDHTMAGPSVG